MSKKMHAFQRRKNASLGSSKGQIGKENHPIPTRVRTTSRTRHPGSRVILPMGGISQDMKKQDKLVVGNEESIVENQCFMTIGCSNEQVEDCARHQRNHKVRYSLVKR